MPEENKCPVCGGKIMVDLGREGGVFYCGSCGTMFAFPTPSKVLAMIEKAREANDANTVLRGVLLAQPM